MPGPGHLLDGDVAVRRVSDAVVVTTGRLLLLGVRRGDVILVDEAPLGDVRVLSVLEPRRGPDPDGLELLVHSQRVRVRAQRPYARRVRDAWIAMNDARAEAHYEAVGRPRPVEAALCGRSFHLVVRIEDYQFPWAEPDEEEEYDADANWLYAMAWVKLPDGREQRMDRDPCLETIDLQRFVDELRALVRKRSGTARLAPVEPGVGLTIKLSDREGTISGSLTDLEFHDIPTDLTRLEEGLGEFTALAAAFPRRGPGM